MNLTLFGSRSKLLFSNYKTFPKHKKNPKEKHKVH